MPIQDQRSHLYFTEMDSPIGPLVLCATEEALCRIEFGAFPQVQENVQELSNLPGGMFQYNPSHPILQEATKQLQQYFAGERTVFDLPLLPLGTHFQQKVWSALTEIPFGETRSYKQIGESIGQPKAVRAVGGANNRNPLPIVIPCHRVIGANGDMIGYGGGLALKEALLNLEGYQPTN